MQTVTGKLIGVILSLFLLAYVGFQAYRYLYSPVKTETAMSYVIEDSFETAGLVIRDEQVMDVSVSDGVVSYLHEDGVKTLVGTALAEVYPDSRAVQDAQRIEAIDAEIELLTSIQNPSTSYYLDPDGITKEIDDQLYRAIGYIDSGELAGYDEACSDLLTNINKKQIVTGEVEDFSQKIDALKQERASLASVDHQAQRTIYADSETYFSSYVDDGVGALLPDQLETITFDELSSLLERDYIQLEDRFGKTIATYRWNLVVIADEQQALKLQEGVSVDLDLGLDGGTMVPAVVSKTISSDQTTDVAVVFECEYLDAQLTRLRSPHVEVEYQRYSGLKIPSKAVRYVDGVRGVYVKKGNVILFKKLDVVYEGSGFVLSQENADDDYVQRFDDVVTGGTDLYDGKIVN